MTSHVTENEIVKRDTCETQLENSFFYDLGLKGWNPLQKSHIIIIEIDDSLKIFSIYIKLFEL